MSNLVNKICFLVIMDKFPGIDNITTDNVYRSLGDSVSRERIGVGFMNKGGVERDNIDHRFPFYVIVYVLHGQGTFIDSHGQHFPLAAGSFFQRIPGELHSNLIDPQSGWKECFVEIGRELFAAYQAMRIIRLDFRVGIMPQESTFVERLWNLHRQMKFADEYELPRLIPEILSIITETHQQQWHNAHNSLRRMIESACGYLSRDLDRRLDLEDFCQRQGWGYETFRKKFKEQMGISPGQYRIRRRIDAACEMLNNRNLHISDIAFRLGYKSQYEFSSQFKEYTGLPPMQFRTGGGKERNH